MDYLKRFWTWLTDDHAVFTTATVARYFLRCGTCSRVVPHYWVCKPVGDTGRVGCTCGGIHVRQARIPEWRAAYYVLSRLVWRKWILRKVYWDPRMPTRELTLDV